MIIYFSIIFFIFGSFFGSFFNVVGLRIPKKESIIFPPSHCPKCNHKLKWYELIPLFSYIFLKGKCKDCKERISIIYPLSEFITGVLFALCYIVFGFTFETILAILFISILIIIVISDIKYMIIPDEVIMVGLALLIACSLLVYSPYEVAISALHGIAAFGVMYLIKKFGDLAFKKETMGGGDIKLMLIIGFMLGVSLSIVNIFIASIIAFPVAIIILITKKTNMIPFGPFLAIASIILYLTQTSFDKIIELLY